MARPRRPSEPSSYQNQPEIPPALTKRFSVVRAVIGERTTISDAAKELGIARVNMQTIVHRAEAAIVSALEPRPTGPPAKPPSEKNLEARVAQLEKENAKLQKQLQAADDMMMAAGEIIRSLRGLPPASSRTSSSRSKRSPQKPSSSDEDPEPARLEATLRSALERLRTITRDHRRTARVLGIDVRTLTRWISRLCTGRPLIQRRGGVMRDGPPASEQRVRELVAELHGLSGADSLARSVVGVSRRRAAQLKHEVTTELERSRKQACARVTISEPGVVRGFDAMYLNTGFALHVADASVPYRTSLVQVPTYDAEHVAALLDADFQTHGAPLVLRDDCARCHTAPVVLSVLSKHRVALLQGPPYYAQYYGQLERQNGEHRRWLARLEPTSDDIQPALDRMKTSINDHWLRPTLQWRTAAECWQARRTLDAERDSFLDEVQQRDARLRARDIELRLAMRLAIEQALTNRGYLRITPGRMALCE